MRVFFDHQIFTLQNYGGISNYIVNLVNNFSNEINPLIISPIYKNYYLKKSKYSHKFLFLKRFGFLYSPISKINQIYFKNYSNFKKPEIIHYSYFNEKIFYKSTAKKIITEYDLIKEKLYQNKFKDQIDYKRKLFKQIDHVICISNNTKKDLQQIYNLDETKISVTHLAVKKDENFEKKKMNVKPFILYVGSRDRYKNFKNMIKAYSFSEKLKFDFNVVCFGGGKFNSDEKKLFQELGLTRSKVKYFDGNELDLNNLYKNAQIFIFPSLYEGFGIPLLEAMNMGCPILCSDTSCFPEVAGNSAVFFDPYNIESIKNKMEKVAYDDELKAELIKNGNINLSKYSWKKCALETEAIYKKLF